MSIIGSLIGGAFSLLGNSQNNKNSMNMLNAQNEFTEKMWNQNNEYNNPTNTLQRYIDAGLTPAAAVQAMTGQSGQASQVQSSSQQAPQMNLGQDVLAGYNMDLQKDLIQSQVDKNYSDSGLSKEQAQTEREMREFNVEYQKQLAKLTEDQRSKIWSDIGKLEKERELVEAQKILTDLQSQQMSQIVKMLPTMQQAELQALRNKAFADLESGKLSQAQQGVAKATIAVCKKQEELLGAQKDYVQSQTEGQDIQNATSAGMQEGQIQKSNAEGAGAMMDLGFNGMDAYEKLQNSVQGTKRSMYYPNKKMSKTKDTRWTRYTDRQGTATRR